MSNDFCCRLYFAIYSGAGKCTIGSAMQCLIILNAIGTIICNLNALLHTLFAKCVRVFIL